MRTPHPTLTPQELAIMKVVWRLDKATVRDVYEALRDKRPVAYTTVMTMMKILEDKGYLKKTLVDRAHVYRPAQRAAAGGRRDAARLPRSRLRRRAGDFWCTSRKTTS